MGQTAEVNAIEVVGSAHFTGGVLLVKSHFCLHSLNWIQQTPTATAELGAQYMDTPAPIIEQSLQINLFEYVTAAAAQP